MGVQARASHAGSQPLRDNEQLSSHVGIEISEIGRMHNGHNEQVPRVDGLNVHERDAGLVSIDYGQHPAREQLDATATAINNALSHRE